jgi:hypothetical protein
MSKRLCALGLLFLLATAGSRIDMGGTPTDAAVARVGDIVGRVVDPIGQPLPGVSVTTIPEFGGLARRAATGSDGAYRLEMLPDGTYRVDFELLGFDLIRRNGVRVRKAASTRVDASLPVSTICECVEFVPPTPLTQRTGQVVDEADRPVPYARVEVVSPMRREVAYADTEGRFLIRVPVDETWPLTAFDSGFHAVTQQVSGSVPELIVFRLAHAGTTGLPNHERFGRGCRCPGDLFSHRGR